MKTYAIGKPKFSYAEWLSYITLRILIPPILLWDLLQFSFNKLFGKYIGSKILHATVRFNENYFQAAEKYLKKKSSHERFIINTHDGAVLDSIEIRGAAKGLKATDPVYIIHFCGNAAAYEERIDSMEQEAIELNCNVIGFNYRGVSKSKKVTESAQDLVIDGIAQVQRLLDKGVPPGKIILKAPSLGGGVATLVTHHFHQQGQAINLFNDRSFSSLTNAAVGLIRRQGSQNGHQTSLSYFLLGYLAKPFIKVGLVLTKWEMDAADAFRAIPEKNKEYILVRTSKKPGNAAIDAAVVDDRIITHYASLHYALKSQRREQKQEIDVIAENLTSATPKFYYRAQSDLIRAKQAIKEGKEKFKDRKMHSKDPQRDGHNMAHIYLKNHKGKTAQEYFHEFVQEISERPSLSMR